MDETQRAKLQQKLDELLKKCDTLTAQRAECRALYANAFQEYGSELGRDESSEQLSREIRECQGEINVLLAALTGPVDFSDEAIAKMEKMIEETKWAITVLENGLAQLRRLRSYL